ncbi:MAG TPA: hypothetical protein VIJ22_07955, partial [Polyangiaceae bacterium]
RRRGVFRTALVLLGAGVTGCSLSGLDTQYGVADGSAVNADGASAGDAAGAGDGCKPTEDCTNGIDDDCNGLVDCADPGCTTAGFACTAGPVPSGWTLVAYSATTRPVCPNSYGVETAIVGSPAGAADACGCTCSGGPAVCAGTASYSGYPNACTTGATQVNLGVNNGSCGAVGTTVTAGDYYQLYFASTAVAQQGACSGTGKITSAPAPTFNAGATCASPSQLGAGCTAGVCAPPTGSVFAACVAHAGSVACPTFGFTQQVLVSTGSPGYVDMRACGACPCATGLTCGTVSNVALFSNGTCAGGAAYNINTGCQLPTTSASIGSYEVAYAVSGDATCQPTGSSPPTGSVTLDSNVETICCAP